MAENFCQTDDSMDGKENYKQINYKINYEIINKVIWLFVAIRARDDKCKKQGQYWH